VLNKADLLPEEDRLKAAKDIVKRLKWKGPWYLVSAIGREGTWPICLEAQKFFDEQRRALRESEEGRVG
jgi:GTP-binding protein